MATQTVAVRKPIAALSRNPADPAQHIDWGLLAATLALCAIGVVAIYTATFSAFSLAGGDTLYYVKRQVIALAIGLAVMVVAMVVDYRKWRDLAVGIFLATLALLVLLIVMGRRVNGSEAWFNIGPFQLQPSELVKVVARTDARRVRGERALPRFAVHPLRRSRSCSSPFLLPSCSRSPTSARRRCSSSSRWPCCSSAAPTPATSRSSRC